MAKNNLNRFAKKIKTLKNLYLNIPSPNHVTINLTPECNHRCIYCEIGQGLVTKTKPLISFDDVKWVIDEMNAMDIKLLVLSGGEPFLFKHLFDVVLYAYSLGIHCTIISNGMIISSLSNNKLEILKKCNIRINISIDSFKPKIQEFIRGVEGTLNKQIDGIHTLLKNGIDTGLLTVISAYNFEDIFEVVTKACGLGINSVSFQPVIFNSNYSVVEPIFNKFQLNIGPNDIEKIEKQFFEIIKFEKLNNVNTNIYILQKWLKYYILYLNNPKEQDPFFLHFIKKFFCVPLFRNITISFNGELLPCNMLKPGKSIKQRNGKSLLELWNGTCQTMRLKIKSGKFPKECKSCVCAFDKNLTFSVIKHPISNMGVISATFIKGIIRQLFHG